ncbi:ergot alkaloid biosynthesis protein [Actinocorallia sp. A-T 12471]|uniref:ergot alkaloid biosynthesis protein n=1 Tax=Actinocorallia sp. A-T 12471 TaxID=3089813 RepID=UPI0029CD8241|nr:ergot alkaloid biosynthesis protein [Actinocorallia sp. A-T 12471]MDX6741531.1 ergot alkaloid biosynthesis protein [Actinocorallia sp. A-T 12471]
MSGVLVTGASGTTGSRVAARLTARGARVRAASRSSAVAFDWYDPGTHRGAVDGVDRMYLVPPVRDPDPQAVMLPFLDLARTAGVRRVVLLSNSLIAAGGPSTGVVHQAISETFEEWAVLRPGWFMQNVIGGHAHAACLRATSTIATSAGDGRAAFVDAGDIAEVAAETLLSAVPANTDLVLTGPESLSYDTVAAILTQTTGREITHRRLDPADQPAFYRALGLPEATGHFLVAMDSIVAAGMEDRTTDTVERVTGTPARSFRDFAMAEFPG